MRRTPAQAVKKPPVADAEASDEESENENEEPSADATAQETNGSP